MIFRAEEYFQSGTERIRQALVLHKEGSSYSMAIYCGGLAVECILRAFRWRKDASFEGRHDLQDLTKASQFLRLNDDWMRSHGVTEDKAQDYTKRIRAAMNEVVALWHNNLRFASDARLRALLNERGRLRGKGDPLKRNSLVFLESAHFIVSHGVVLWTSKTR